MSDATKTTATVEPAKNRGTELLESINDTLQSYLHEVKKNVSLVRKRESESLQELYKALLVAQGMFSDVNKSGIIGGRNIPYAKINDLVEASRGALKKNGLVLNWFILPNCDGSESVVARLYHTGSGQFMESELVLLNNTEEQKRGSSLTYAARYLYPLLIGLVDNSCDDDGEITKSPANYNKATFRS